MSFFYFIVLLLSLGGLDKANSQPAQKFPARITSVNGDINCFVYHRFGESRYPSTNITVEEFENHLQYLKQNNYTVLPLGEALERLYSSQTLPQKTAVLTIDDGYHSVKTGAFPLLKKYDYPATLFICTKYVGGSNYLSWKEIQALRDGGIEIGNHSHSHAHFLNYPPSSRANQFKEDLKQAEQLFQEHLGIIPDLYAYPYGEYDTIMMNILQQQGYKGGAAQKSGVIFKETPYYELPRFPMTSSFGRLEKFREKIAMKALRVVKKSPVQSVVNDQNPPSLRLWVHNDLINANGLQCFVDGSKACEITHKAGQSLQITVVADRELQGRRTLYTITAPSVKGDQWFWYSHLWVLPSKPEE